MSLPHLKNINVTVIVSWHRSYYRAYLKNEDEKTTNNFNTVIPCILA